MLLVRSDVLQASGAQAAGGLTLKLSLLLLQVPPSIHRKGQPQSCFVDHPASL